MTNKVTLIVPDIHHDWQTAEKIIASVKHDEVIFLGDYFDDFYDTAEMVRSTCVWLKDSVSKPNRIHLFGNHDVHYAFSYRTFQCSGYEQWKYFIIHDSVPRDVWDKVKWYHILDDTWLLTHAGLHRLNLPEKISKLHKDRPLFLRTIGEFLDKSIRKAFQCSANNQAFWVLNAGRSRGGMQRVGGITWCDFEREFAPIKGLNQILGHTPQGLGFPKWCLLDEKDAVTFPPCHLWTPTEQGLANPNTSVNVDLDVYKNMQYAVWDGKTLSVKSQNSL
jgi:hypothetical protein